MTITATVRPWHQETRPCKGRWAVEAGHLRTALLREQLALLLSVLVILDMDGIWIAMATGSVANSLTQSVDHQPVSTHPATAIASVKGILR